MCVNVNKNKIKRIISTLSQLCSQKNPSFMFEKRQSVTHTLILFIRFMKWEIISMMILYSFEDALLLHIHATTKTKTTSLNKNQMLMCLE